MPEQEEQGSSRGYVFLGAILAAFVYVVSEDNAVLEDVLDEYKFDATTLHSKYESNYY